MIYTQYSPYRGALPYVLLIPMIEHKNSSNGFSESTFVTGSFDTTHRPYGI